MSLVKCTTINNSFSQNIICFIAIKFYKRMLKKFAGNQGIWEVIKLKHCFGLPQERLFDIKTLFKEGVLKSYFLKIIY
ncbi:hypothetical protein [Desnuesiella massiliensis]|uniref:hypothetical protein n=1 Tax=Desnuesiella massiliensis TaxID=1650662 RepID=UPI0006E35363|nr:hypothetical protein [Desnuesiella massiliensis]